MKGNRGKNTKPELLVRGMLREAGFPGYRVHWSGAPGRPDIAYPGRKVAIFVNGCYWHRCPTCNPPTPKAHAEFWTTKFIANEDRDKRQVASLQEAGWTVIVIWECALKKEPELAIAEAVAVLKRQSTRC